MFFFLLWTPFCPSTFFRSSSHLTDRPSSRNVDTHQKLLHFCLFPISLPVRSTKKPRHCHSCIGHQDTTPPPPMSRISVRNTKPFFLSGSSLPNRRSPRAVSFPPPPSHRGGIAHCVYTQAHTHTHTHAHRIATVPPTPSPTPTPCHLPDYLGRLLPCTSLSAVHPSAGPGLGLSRTVLPARRALRREPEPEPEARQHSHSRLLREAPPTTKSSQGFLHTLTEYLHPAFFSPLITSGLCPQYLPGLPATCSTLIWAVSTQLLSSELWFLHPPLPYQRHISYLGTSTGQLSLCLSQ